MRTSPSFLALAAGLGTSTIYPLQPAIAEVATSLDSSAAAVGLALACGTVGYLAGLALVVPLVDLLPAGRVLAVQYAVLALALAASAAVGSVVLLAPLTGLVGACSTVGAGLSSLAGRWAAPGRRAAVLGAVTAGISGGILAGRIVGGWLADGLGWRGMLLVLAAACAATALACLVALPSAGRPALTRGYLATVRSLPVLLVRDATLRSAAVRGALWFFAFCAVWSGLAVALSAPPYSYSAERIGLFALAGLSGLLATRVAGAWTDRVGARRVVLAGLAVAGTAAAVLGVGLGSDVLTLACLAVFDAGLFAAQVANQSTVLALDPAAPARFNSAYMVVYFIGGSLGTACGAVAVDLLGWPVTAVAAAAAVGLAAIATVLVVPQPVAGTTPAPAR